MENNSNITEIKTAGQSVDSVLYGQLTAEIMQAISNENPYISTSIYHGRVSISYNMGDVSIKAFENQTSLIKDAVGTTLGRYIQTEDRITDQYLYRTFMVEHGVKWEVMITMQVVAAT